MRDKLHNSNRASDLNRSHKSSFAFNKTLAFGAIAVLLLCAVIGVVFSLHRSREVAQSTAIPAPDLERGADREFDSPGVSDVGTAARPLTKSGTLLMPLINRVAPAVREYLDIPPRNWRVDAVPNSFPAKQPVAEKRLRPETTTGPAKPGPLLSIVAEKMDPKKKGLLDLLPATEQPEQ